MICLPSSRIWQTPNPWLAFRHAQYVLWSVGFDASGANREAIWIDGLRNLIRSLPEAPEAFVYVSSTSVYANGDGSDVDEDSEVGPISEGGKCCVRAETLMNEELGRRFPDTKRIVLRHAGIYGPNRLLRRVEDLRASKPLPGDGDTWLNLIHVDDAVRLIRHVLPSPAPPNLINVVNTETVTRRLYYTRLAELTGTPEPQFGGNASRRARGGNKRVMTRHQSLTEAADYRFDDVLEIGLPDAVGRSDNL